MYSLFYLFLSITMQANSRIKNYINQPVRTFDAMKFVYEDDQATIHYQKTVFGHIGK